MLKTTLKTLDDLDTWLSHNYGFEDGHVLEIYQNPLQIIVGYNIKGNYEGNSERHIRSFKLIPSEIFEWTYSEFHPEPSDNNYIESIEAVYVEKGICLAFLTPALYRLTANSIDIEEQELIVTTFKPWISEHEMYVCADIQDIPKPEYWQQELKKFGHDISFRFYGGEEINMVEEVPYPDYQGYYIQLNNRIKTTMEGIFLEHLKVEAGKLILSFKNRDEYLKLIWNDLTAILANLPNAKINCGNCNFTGKEWKYYLVEKAGGASPPHTT